MNWSRPIGEISSAVKSVAAAAPFLQRACACGQHTVGGECEECKKKNTTLQRSNSSGLVGPALAPPIVHEVLQSPGQCLDATERAFFEPRFQYDFSQVRVHTDAKAAESAELVNALAYTVGKDIVFAAGEYAPSDDKGKRLLAHELTHVVQQRHTIDGVPRAIEIEAPRTSLEREADSSVEHVTRMEADFPKHELTYVRRQGHRVQSINSALQRSEVKYIEQVKGEEAEPFLERFDQSLAEIEKAIKGAPGAEANALRDAAARLRVLRGAGRITAWRTSGGLNYASYHNQSRELRLHVYFGGKATSQSTLIHEAIHAVHAGQYPELGRMYGEALDAGGTTNESLGVLLLKWKAWTEYWAYRRQAEYSSLVAGPEFKHLQQDPHTAAMQERDVKGSIARVRDLTGKDFDPTQWIPPKKYRAKEKPGRKEERPAKSESK